jgi:hypothetical protein
LTPVNGGVYLASAGRFTTRKNPLEIGIGGLVKKRGFVVLVSVVSSSLLFACARHAEPDGGGKASAPVAADVVSSLEVKVGRDSVELILHATNPTSKPVTLEFNTGQRYDFLILDAAGQAEWRWGQDHMFTQALGREVLAPGQGLQYRAVWKPGARRGRFVAVGRVPAVGRPLEQRTEFELSQ